jgi:dihydrofolate reductase
VPYGPTNLPPYLPGNCETMKACGSCSLLSQSAHMRKLRYSVAMSLDGLIAGPNGEYDWIGNEPGVDFAAFWSQFDTLLMGRRTYDLAVQTRGKAAFTAFTGVTSIVFSRTLKQQEHPHVTVMPELNADWVRGLKAQSGKDIWLFGGSNLFRSLFDSGLVDRVEVAVIPVLLGSGIRLLPPPYTPTRLRLVSHHLYQSGRMSLAYEVQC